ncbi:hypothetical protein SEVIR_7G320200v4 [Setaria viridis]|uniref:Uncharacterized protein n=1 Tax=Setaria viridis TaxID=4556 RepID=A0A4U6TXL1_SETVI|nr:hypothetical protein SEVIR_7G320200v2 [Setaria viridis]
MGSPLAGAGAAALKDRAWALLHRTPQFVDAEKFPAGIHYAVKCAKPPKLSELSISRARALLAAGDHAEDVVGRVLCTDGESNILVAVWSESEEQGRPSSPPRLLVCRPGSGSVDLVPPIPEHLAEHGVLEAALLGGIGIVPGPRGGGHYLITLLGAEDSSSSSSPAAASRRADQRAGASSSSSSAAPAPRRAHLRALVYCSSSSSWTTKEVRPRRFHAPSGDDEDHWGIWKEEELPPTFKPDGVLCQDTMRQHVFMDEEHGLVLLFDPNADTARLVPFPVHGAEADELGLEDDEARVTGQSMAYTNGRICLLRSAGGSVRTWYLQEGDWELLFDVPREMCLPSSSGQLLAFDPTYACNITFLVMSGAKQIYQAVTVAVDLLETALPTVKVVEVDVLASSASCREIVIWWFNPASPVVQAAGPRRSSQLMPHLSAKSLGGMARSAISIGRQHIERVGPLAEVVGTMAEVCGVPFGSKIAPAVAQLVTVNQAARLGEEFLDWLQKPSPRDVRVVETRKDATSVIEEWINSGKPKSMVVQPAPGLSDDQLLALSRFFKDKGAHELLRLPPTPSEVGEDYYMVSNAAPHFPPV